MLRENRWIHLITSSLTIVHGRKLLLDDHLLFAQVLCLTDRLIRHPYSKDMYKQKKTCIRRGHLKPQYSQMLHGKWIWHIFVVSYSIDRFHSRGQLACDQAFLTMKKGKGEYKGGRVWSQVSCQQPFEFTGTKASVNIWKELNSFKICMPGTVIWLP